MCTRFYGYRNIGGEALLVRPPRTVDSVAGVCRWCAKMELRRPRFNFMPRHAFATEVPEELRRQAAGAIERALKGPSNRGVDS